MRVGRVKKRLMLRMLLLPGTLLLLASVACSGRLTYQPPKPEDAPEDIREAVLLGRDIMLDTPGHLPENVGNEMNCTNCHFQAGLTEGGKEGGISLVGVGATYPRFRPRQDYSVNLVTRVNDWLERSENGKVLPSDSKELTAMVTYLQWISKDIPVYTDVPWLGVGSLDGYQEGNTETGTQVYTGKCSACHGPEGQGTPAGPPLWGNGSYNDGAGMARPETLASFAFRNMPLGNPDLTQQEAQDVGIFVNSQPRPHFEKQQTP